MDLQLKMIAFALLVLQVSSSARAQSGVFDISKYGGAPNGDITQVRFLYICLLHKIGEINMIISNFGFHNFNPNRL